MGLRYPNETSGGAIPRRVARRGPLSVKRRLSQSHLLSVREGEGGGVAAYLPSRVYPVSMLNVKLNISERLRDRPRIIRG